MTNRRLSDVRIIWAIAAKDIVDAVKNKALLQTVITVFVMIAFYKALPLLSGLSGVPQVSVYDAGNSALALDLQDSSTVEARRVSSLHEMELFVAMGGTPELGLAIPAGFDASVAAGGPLVLDAYVQHWVNDAAAEKLADRVQAEVASLVGKPVKLNLDGHWVYPTLESMGPHSWASLSMIMMLLMIGLGMTPQLMIEEKRAHTLDALLVSPASSGQVVLGKAIAGMAYCLACAVVVLAFYAGLIVQWPFAILAACCGSLVAVAIGLWLGLTVEVLQSLRMWTLTIIVPLFLLPVVASFMAMDLPRVVNAVVRWFPSVAASRLFIMSMSNRAPLAEYGPDLALILVPTAIALAAVAWRVRRSDR
jgi:ABC-type Na+ efflux pump permease subunit